MSPSQPLYHANEALFSIQVGTNASGHVHALRCMGYLSIGYPSLCSRNTIYILTKTRAENTQRYQIQEEPIWNLLEGLFGVQSSVLSLFLHRPSLSELLIDRASVFHF